MQQPILTVLRDAPEFRRMEDALAEVPDKYHREVCASLTHDIGVSARTISMVEKQPCEEGK